MIKDAKNMFISLSFEKAVLPPFEDILILGRENPMGMNGVGECIDLLVPDGFDRFEVDDDHVAAVIINKNILLRLKANETIKILREKVFPFIGKAEIVKVQFTTKVIYENFSAEL